MKIKVHAETKLSGHYEKIEILHADGSLKQEHAGFSNLIVDGGLARLALDGNVPVFNFCRVGTGSATPTESDNNLQSQIASTSAASFVLANDITGGFCSTTVTYTFALGAVVGNIAEIATGWAASGIGTIFSRARILDGNGNPTAITILEDEILRVTWTHRRYWPTADSTGILTNTGNKGGSFDWLCRAASVGSWRSGALSRAVLGLAAINSNAASVGAPAFYTGASELGLITGRPSGALSANNSFTATLIGSGANESTLRLSFSTAQGNVAGGIKVFKFGSGANGESDVEYQIEFTPALVKTNNDLMQIDFSHSWGRR